MSAQARLPIVKVRKHGESNFVLDHCALAKTFFSRFWGLMPRASLAANEGLLLERCNQIHMFFMKFPIDALFLDQSDHIVAIESIKPWRLSRLHFKASKVLEVPYGAAEQWGWNKGDRLEFISERGES